jgi:hypothetical protein
MSESLSVRTRFRFDRTHEEYAPQLGQQSNRALVVASHRLQANIRVILPAMGLLDDLLGGATKRKRAPRKFTGRRVRLTKGGYDSRGKYWGVGAPLYLVENNPDGWYQHVRAHSAAEAIRIARAHRTGWR